MINLAHVLLFHEILYLKVKRRCRFIAWYYEVWRKVISSDFTFYPLVTGPVHSCAISTPRKSCSPAVIPAHWIYRTYCHLCQVVVNQPIVHVTFNGELVRLLYEFRKNKYIGKSCSSGIFRKSTSVAYPSKHDILKQCYFNVVPTSSKLAQHYNNVVSMYRAVYPVAACLAHPSLYTCAVTRPFSQSPEPLHIQTPLGFREVSDYDLIPEKWSHLLIDACITLTTLNYVCINHGAQNRMWMMLTWSGW